MKSDHADQNPKKIKSGQIYMKDLESAEQKEKLNFKFLFFRLETSIQKHSGSRGAAPVGGAREGIPPQKKIIFCSNIFQNFEFFFSLKFFKFTQNIQNRLNRKKNQVFDFCDFYFSSLGHFCTFQTPIFDEFSPITRKIKFGEFFHYFSHTIQHTPHNK